MNVVRYQPARVLRRFHDEVDRMFDHSRYSSREADREWTPAIDVQEEEQRFVITADVPGVNPQDIEITMQEGVLSISGSRVGREDDSRQGHRRVERITGRFDRRFSLPEATDADAITASSSHGVLRVDIPKKQVVQPRRIAVN